MIHNILKDDNDFILEDVCCSYNEKLHSFFLQWDGFSYANTVIVISLCEHLITFQKSFHIHGTNSEQRKITVICNTAYKE